jgi:sugar phosphate isomerase/epimerase
MTQLLVFRALWGMTGSVPEQIERIAAAGYDGFEIWPDQFDISREELLSIARRNNMKVIVGALVPSADEIERTFKRLAEYEPVRINIHGGRDSMSRDEGCKYFEEALRVESQIGVPVGHETHRGRILFTPWDTAFYLRQFDSLKLTADYSHWVNVCERMPEDQAAAIELANQRAVHIHGRVGYEEGPQVPDPSAPEYAGHLRWHETQWKQIAQAHKDRGQDRLTFTPEYGPPNYLHTLPHTNVPVADLWQVCLWAAAHAREQFRSAL